MEPDYGCRRERRRKQEEGKGIGLIHIHQSMAAYYPDPLSLGSSSHHIVIYWGTITRSEATKGWRGSEVMVQRWGDAEERGQSSSTNDGGDMKG